MNNRFWIIRFNKVFFLYVLFFFYLGINFYLTNKFFPINEGWWENYVYLIKIKNQILYKDIYLAFPPFFIYLYRIIIDFIGINFYYLRVFGVIVVGVNLVLSIFLIKLVYKKDFYTYWPISVSFMLMMQPFFLPIDYHSFYLFFTVLSFLFYFMCYKSYVSKNSFFMSLFSILLGCCISMLTLIKQNIGFFLGISVIFSFFIFFPRSKKHKKAVILLYILSGILTGTIFLLFLIQSHSFSYFLQTMLKNDSKGSFSYIFIKFILNSVFLFKWIIPLVFAVMLFFIKYKYKIFFKKLSLMIQRNIYLYIIICSIVIIFFPQIINSYITVFLVLTIFFYQIIMVLNNFLYKRINNRYLIFSLLLLGMIYSGTMTSGEGFDTMTVVLPILLCVPFFINYLYVNFKINSWFFIILTFLLGLSVLVQKYICPYAWWGVKSPSISSLKYELPFQELENIYVDKQTFKIFSSIKNIVNKYSKSQEDVLFFPHMPIFYLLLNKIPPLGVPVYFFDVTNTTEVKKLINYLDAEKPSVIVYETFPSFAYKVHYMMKQENLLQYKVQCLLENLVKEKRYYLLKHFYIYKYYQPNYKKVLFNYFYNGPSFIKGQESFYINILVKRNLLYDNKYYETL